jgi:AraC-like DNA-binding protein
MMASESETLKKLASKIRPPKSYFKGLPLVDFEIPKNLIIFHRSRAGDLEQNFQFHYHHRFVLIINLESEGKVVVDNQTFEFSSGQAILIFPYQFHHYLQVESKSINWLFITFELYDSSLIESLRNRVTRISDNCYTYLSYLLKQYLKRKLADRERTHIFLLTAIVLWELQQNFVRTKSQKALVRISLIDKVNAYLWDNIGNKVKLPELAKKFMLSESHLRYLFRRKMGMSIGHYIQKLRANRARSFLINSDLNISEVAFRCGYDSLYTFSRAFKKNIGLSPREYRKKMLAE